MSSNEEIFKKIYLNPRTGFQSAQNTYKKIKKDYPSFKITRKQVEEFIKNQSTAQIHGKQKVDVSDYNTIKARKIGMFQMDLIQMTNYKSHNEGYNYILILQDIVSRY